MEGIRNEGRIWYSAMIRPKNFRSRSFSNPDMMKKAPSINLSAVINAGGKPNFVIGILFFLVNDMARHCFNGSSSFNWETCMSPFDQTA